MRSPGLVFPNTKGKIRRRDSAVRSFKRYLEEAGIPTDVRFHDLRHTAGTLALRQGVPLHTVSKMLGHSDTAMNLKHPSSLHFLSPAGRGICHPLQLETPTCVPSEG